MVQSTSKTILVSVIVPMYNAERFITAALSSILREKAIPLEVIVVNDGSTDGSLRKVHEVRDDRLRIVNCNGKGIADALNTGLDAARGEIITRCDADDLYPRRRLVRQVKWLTAHSEFGAVSGGYAAIDSRGLPIIKLDCGNETDEITKELQAGITRTHFCTYAVRAELLRAVGGCRSYFTTGEDIDLQLRLGEICRIGYVPNVHYYYRLHNASITHTKSSTEREFFDSIAREFQKQRLSQGHDDLQQNRPPKLPQHLDKPPLTASQHIQGFLLGEAWREHRDGQKWQAVITGMRSALVSPANLAAWRSLLALAVKPVSSSSAYL